VRDSELRYHHAALARDSAQIAYARRARAYLFLYAQSAASARAFARLCAMLCLFHLYYAADARRRQLHMRRAFMRMFIAPTRTFRDARKSARVIIVTSADAHASAVSAARSLMGAEGSRCVRGVAAPTIRHHWYRGEASAPPALCRYEVRRAEAGWRGAPIKMRECAFFASSACEVMICEKPPSPPRSPRCHVDFWQRRDATRFSQRR